MTFQCATCGTVKPKSEFYATTKLRRGHYNECKSCWNERARLYRKKNWPRCYETRRRYKLKNPAKVAGLTRKSALKVRYGITPDDFDLMVRKQNGCCAICGVKTDKLCIDHCHSTGRTRALLCNSCNVGIGAFKDDPELLKKTAEFIQAYVETQL